MKEREAPLNYQISVSNVTRIASRSMADFYILFSSQASSQQWKSPLVHGKVTKENTRFPWTFISDTHQFTVAFHELDGGVDKMVGSMPLLLLRREGEEQFLIFGCTEANRGRKVAEIDFTYTQCSAAASLPSNPSNEQSKRVSLEYTIQVENYDNKKPLNMIPEEPETSLNRESNPNIKLPEESLVDDFHPSRLETLKIQSNRPRMSEDSNFELNLIRQMQDATDRWYRNNFGKQKPSDLQHLDIEDSRLAVVRYEPSFEYLNELSYTSPHIQLKNLMLLTDKMPQAVELYSIDLDGSQLLKQKVASMEVEGHRYNWPNAVRLPKEKKAYGLQIVTVDKQKLQGVIIKDSNTKHVVEIYNRSGKPVGKANYTLKQIKKIQIQTMQIMQLNPTPQNKRQANSEKESTNELDKSFLKTANNRSLINELLRSDNQPSFREKNKLIKEIYLNRTRQEPIQQQTRPLRPLQREQMMPPPRRQMTNHAYLQQPETTYQKPKNFRKNKFEIDHSQSHSQPHSQSHHQQHSTPQQSRPIQSKSTITQSPFLQFPLPMQPKTAKSQQQQQAYVSPPSGSSANQFLPESSRQQFDDKPADEPQILSKRIQQLKKIGSDIGKKAKNFPSKKFTKNAKYKTVIYNQDEQQRQWQAKRSKEHSDSGKQQQTHKKTYRQPINASNSSVPINATPSFQSLLVNNTFSKDIKNSKPVGKNNNTQIQLKKQKQQPQTNNHNILALNSSDTSGPQLNDDSEQIPIMRHKTADQNVLKAMISQKEAQINKKKNPIKAEEQRKASQFGVNTERMSIVQNVLQSSVAPTPTTPTQKRASPQLQDLKSIDYEDWQGKRSSKEDVGSMRQSALRHSHQTKFSSQTIQPATQMPAGKINFLITSISISYYHNCFGSKFVKVYVPNRHYYETSHSTSATNFFWKCSGFLFSKIQQHQDIYLQLINSDGNEQRMIGRLILNATEFKPGVEQAVIRAYLVLQNKIVGEVVVGYETVGKARQVEGKRGTVSLDHARYAKQKKESTTPIKRAKKAKRKQKMLNDSLTNFLRQHRKQKINRYMVNQYSRAHIDSRITPSVPKKYTAGKNIVIGRDIRFPLTVQQQHHTVVPGPGAYRQSSQFQRYK